ncbi:MAG: hypothetical protein ACFFBD_21685 [Candidatus Hodarchaeota archaeon]
MLLEFLVGVQVICGFLLGSCGLIILKKNIHDYLHQLLGGAIFLMGISCFIDVIPQLLHDASLFLLTEYIVFFTISLASCSFFLAGFTTARGEDYGKNPKYVVPSLLLGQIPNIFIFLTQSASVESATILNESILVFIAGEIGDILMAIVWLGLLIGGFFYFYRIYHHIEESKAKTRSGYFLTGIGLMIVSNLLLSVLFFILDPVTSGLIFSFGSFLSLVITSILMTYAFVR